MTRLLILGGGFAGVMAALNAADENDRHGGDIAVTLISATPYLTIRPRLYESTPESLRVPLAPTLEPAGVAFIEAKARSVDTVAKSVAIEDNIAANSVLAYDRLILTTGSQLKLPSIPGIAEHTFNIDSYDGAVTLDRHLQRVTIHADAPGHNTFV